MVKLMFASDTQIYQNFVNIAEIPGIFDWIAVKTFDFDRINRIFQIKESMM